MCVGYINDLECDIFQCVYGAINNIKSFSYTVINLKAMFVYLFID